MRTALRIAAAIAFLGCLLWAVSKPAFDSITASLVAFATLFGTFVTEGGGKATMSQKVGKGSTAIQAGGDVKIDR